MLFYRLADLLLEDIVLYSPLLLLWLQHRVIGKAHILRTRFRIDFIHHVPLIPFAVGMVTQVSPLLQLHLLLAGTVRGLLKDHHRGGWAFRLADITDLQQLDKGIVDIVLCLNRRDRDLFDQLHLIRLDRP